MKRSGFSKDYTRRRSPDLKPIVGQRGVYATSGLDCITAPKQMLERNEPYRRYVASKPCFKCGIEGYSQAAHPNFLKALGMKTDDRLVFPLCCTRPGVVGCHVELDQLIGMTREERREREAAYTTRMRDIAVMEGWDV